jgi:integrase/recombinase XerD
MKVEENLSILTTALMESLRDKKYHPGVVKQYRLSFQRLNRYMMVLGTECYNRGVGDAYIKSAFGDTSYIDLASKEKWKVYHINALSEYQENGNPPQNPQKHPEIVFTGDQGIYFDAFIAHKIEMRCVASTIRLYKIRLRPFHLDLVASKQTIPSINRPYLIQFLSRLDMTQKPAERNNILTVVRLFLKYLCAENVLATNQEKYWISVLKPRTIRDPQIPSVYSGEEIERLIQAIDRANPRGKRDYAMVLLAARYGLRTSDIVGLRHCNLDWPNNRIVLYQQKTGKKTELPLSEEIGNAIIEYLKFGRPNINEPYIFLTAGAPYGKLTTMNNAIVEHMRKADIGFEERKHGPHALRHSLASNLLGLNESMPVISEILGHSTTKATMYYLRVDFKQLQQCTLEVPCVPASFYDHLYA